MLRPLDPTVAVAPQITPDDVPAIAAAGYVAIVNNRPDGEEAGQPDGESIRVAAEAAGLAYTAIPVTQAGFSRPQVDAMIAALAAADGPVLAYCRSGTRSCNLWALAGAAQGEDAGALTAKAATAGYDLTGLRPLLDAVARQG
ncbi:MAG: TIGR01244 family phosphatase [Sphingomonas taxi]|uniref:TIGR01244 family phosphatase n=1 Tax=Sphingomonas taxi TaxID=1549858 RepID=A0A2W5QY65_9SPHN|nr:MAG: TIGR01244 family phosphatase [Sphingomonas taxi]